MSEIIVDVIAMDIVEGRKPRLSASLVKKLMELIK